MNPAALADSPISPVSASATKNARIRPSDAPELAWERAGERAVRRTIPPRLRVVFGPDGDGWTGSAEWPEGPPAEADAATLARWMREAGEAFAALFGGTP